MKVCDLTQFYSPVSGGVKRYLSEKVRHVRERTERDEHVLIIPGARDEMTEGERSRVYTIKSPLISRTSRYRVLLRLEAIERILEREKPDLIESGDPYQVAWKAVHSGTALRIPVIGFYHSHFPEAYVRTAQKFCGRTVTEFFLDFSRRYIRSLYNRFERTLVPSPALGQVLTDWGVRNIAPIDLGVDTGVFNPQRSSGEDMRRELGIPNDRTLLLYVGRLAQEKNTHTLFAAFHELTRRFPERFELLVVGDGLQRAELNGFQSKIPGRESKISHLPYCADGPRLAAIYRAADLFVHPGVQETFGLVTLEAQACGTPVIGIHGSYMDRIIHSDQTLWARENSPGALAAAIEETSRENLQASGARASRLVAAQYSWKQVFTRLFALYKEVIESYQPR
ncbi:MAG: alpha,6-mannosyltransferase [Chthoniobacter sp.]|jgi:alpha-1,6-mannosyltransferase|nr:alpha,6-mannosyltransferase [Chthoniobacter sp.]